MKKKLKEKGEEWVVEKIVGGIGGALVSLLVVIWADFRIFLTSTRIELWLVLVIALIFLLGGIQYGKSKSDTRTSVNPRPPGEGTSKGKISTLSESLAEVVDGFPQRRKRAEGGIVVNGIRWRWQVDKRGGASNFKAYCNDCGFPLEKEHLPDDPMTYIYKCPSPHCHWPGAKRHIDDLEHTFKFLAD